MRDADIAQHGPGRTHSSACIIDSFVPTSLPVIGACAVSAAGVKEDVIDDIATGRTPKMTPDQQAVWTFIKELDSAHQVSDSTFNNVRQRFGERGVVDLVSLIGYYHTMSMLMNVDRYPMPSSEKPPLQP
jgi:hypothetical protein